MKKANFIGKSVFFFGIENVIFLTLFNGVAITLPTIVLPTITLPTPFCRQVLFADNHFADNHFADKNLS
jgi:hypothetical protein